MARKYLDICRILAGNVQRDDSGVIYPSEKIKKPHVNLDYMGRYNGAFAARVFGLSVRKQKFSMTGSQKAVSDHCYKRLAAMGTPVHAEDLKDAQCVLIWRYMLNPVILAMQLKGKDVTLTAFTARSIFGQIACFRMLNKFYKALDDLLEIKDGERVLDRDAKPGRKERKAQKAEAKKEKEKKKLEKSVEKEKAAEAKQREKTVKPEQQKTSDTPSEAENQPAEAHEKTAKSQNIKTAKMKLRNDKQGRHQSGAGTSAERYEPEPEPEQSPAEEIPDEDYISESEEMTEETEATEVLADTQTVRRGRSSRKGRHSK